MPCLFHLLAMSSVVITTALPYFDDRLFFTVFVTFTLVLFCLLSEVVSRIEDSDSILKNIFSTKYLRLAVPILICLFTLFDFGEEYRTYHRNFVIYTGIVDNIEEKIAAGEKNIKINRGTEVVPKLLEPGRLKNFIFFWSITAVGSDINAMENKWYAYCLGADTLSGG